MKLEDAIRAARALKNLSQKKLGEELGGLTQQDVSAWENGGGIAKEHWEKIKTLLGVDVEAFCKLATQSANLTGNNSPVIQTSGGVGTTSININSHNAPHPGEYTVTLTPGEYQVLMAFRSLKSPDICLDQCMEKLERLRAAFDCR